MRKRAAYWVLLLALMTGADAQAGLQTAEQRFLNTFPAVQPRYSATFKAEAGQPAGYLLDRTREGCGSIYRDRATGTDYLTMPVDFTATGFSPVIYRGGQPIARAFQKDDLGTYPFLLCRSYGKTYVLMRRDLWEAYFAPQFTIRDGRISGSYMFLIVTEQGVEFEKQVNFTEVDSMNETLIPSWISVFAEETRSLRASEVKEVERLLAVDRMALPFATDSTLNRFLRSAVLVDGVYYGPFGQLQESEVIINPRSKADLGRPYTKASAGGQTLTKFIMIGNQPYLALPWWDSDIFQSESALTFDNWMLFSDNTEKYTSTDRTVVGYSVTPPADPKRYSLSALQGTWNETQSAPTRQRWTAYLTSAIRVDGVPAINLTALSAEYDFEVTSTRIMQGGETVATIFDPAMAIPAVRLNGQVFLPVTFLNGSTYDKARDRMTLVHSSTITTSVDVAPFKLKAYTLTQLKQLDQQKAAQQAQATATQQAAAKQQQVAQQKAAQQAQANAAKAAQAQQQAQAAFQKDLAAARQAAPAMIVAGLGGGLFGAAKISSNKLYIRILQVKNGKVTSSCYQQTLDGLHVVSLQSLVGNQGVFYVTFTSPGVLNRVAYTYRANNQFCGFTPVP
ncbi:hypothetical protein [Deinococcus ficus]|uniref:hypothetical protein n=1 Tax=Deinococcus ficus TaxID=317577 RepID=UPI0003B6E770|nr:hypothetical protein [Deinococcus ficus]